MNTLFDIYHKKSKMFSYLLAIWINTNTLYEHLPFSGIEPLGDPINGLFHRLFFIIFHFGVTRLGEVLYVVCSTESWSISTVMVSFVGCFFIVNFGTKKGGKGWSRLDHSSIWRVICYFGCCF